jgi:uncharacterized UPF0160 family protein
MIPEFIVTHSGGFHADELMSSVILTKLFPNAKLIRSRDPGLRQTMIASFMMLVGPMTTRHAFMTTINAGRLVVMTVGP